MKTLTVLIMTLTSLSLSAQQWIDLDFSIETQKDIVYGTAVDFAGALDSLKLDISLPIDDTVSECGRPLAVIIHGGGWLGGDKDEGYARRLRQDFAARGYVAASVNYRLGMFQTDQALNCNIDGWNCLNMTDSSEFYRANFRAMQDVNGAIRYLINRANEYTIDPDHLFLIGESAGGFVAMGVGFIDDPSEILSDFVAAYPDAPPPNASLEQECIQNGGLAPDIDSMDLSRPALGSFEGELNQPLLQPYQVRAVGNIYGGAFNNIFQSYSTSAPGLYMYHQPCDLLVPYNYGRVFSGLAQCAVNLAGCSYLINRPHIYGSRGIKNLIDDLDAGGTSTSDYLFDNTSNNFSCLEQVILANQQCHAIDNYNLRTTNMATYFATFMEECTPTSTDNERASTPLVSLYPNPVNDLLQFDLPDLGGPVMVRLVDPLGKTLFQQRVDQNRELEIELQSWPPGLYFAVITAENHHQTLPFIKN